MVENLTQVRQIFQEVYSGISIGAPLPQGWVSIRNEPLLIIVGLTGVGKSTITNTLSQAGLNFTLLPNRRTLTTELIIPNIAATNGQNVQTICRIERLKYTRQYQRHFPGGMGYLLTQLGVNPSEISYPLIFDGLRGENEVTYAANTFKTAKFLVLDAPISVRLKRLLIRNDSFDKIANNKMTEAEGLMSFANLGIPEASRLFSFDEEQEILDLVRKGIYSSMDVCERLKILLEEGINYDPVATKFALEAIAPERTLVIDTTIYTPQQIAQKVIADLNIDRQKLSRLN